MSRHRGPLSALLASSAILLLLTGPVAATPGWTDPTAIRTQQPEIFDLRMGVDSAGHVSVVGRDEAGLFALGNHGGTWQFVRLASTAETPYVESIAGVFDRAGHSYLVWSRGCDENDCSLGGIWMFTNRDGGPNHGWPLEPVRLVAGQVGQPAFQALGDRLHLVYIDSDMRAHYRTATDPSGPWTDRLVWDDAIAMQPALTLDSHGRANIVAWHGDQLRWARNVGTATAPDFRSRDVPGTTEFDRAPLIALDAEDDPTIAWTRKPYCGVDPCTPDESRGTWVRTWNGASWSRAKHVHLSDLLSLRLDDQGRPRILTDRPSLLERTPSTWTNTVLLWEPVAYRHMVVAGAMALDTQDRARVVFADQVKVPGGWRWVISLRKER